MGLKSVRIIADERERKSGVPTMLKRIGVDLEVKTLPVGDYIVAPETIVERKSIQDLVSSIFDGRLFDQCTRLKKHFERPTVLIEGNMDELDGIIENPLIFYGAVATVVVDFGIPVISTPNATHTAHMLVAMAARKNGAPGGPYLKKIKKSSNLEQQQLSLLCSLPGVGEKFAGRMLQRFGTPLDALSATSVELARVDGMGEARAKKIKNVLISRLKQTDGDEEEEEEEEVQTKLGNTTAS